MLCPVLTLLLKILFPVVFPSLLPLPQSVSATHIDGYVKLGDSPNPVAVILP